MLENVKKKGAPQVHTLVREELGRQNSVSSEALGELDSILDKLPLAYAKVNAIFGSKEKKEKGAGGIFSIYVSDLCKGCGECVTECGDHEALVMSPDGEELNAKITTAHHFLDLLPETPEKYLGKYDAKTPQESRQATLRNHLMVKRNYDALVSGDGACAGCGEKSVLRALASLTEAYMRPLYHTKADRLLVKSAQIDKDGAAKLKALAKDDPESYKWLKRSMAHVVMGLGGETDEDTQTRLEAHGELSDEEVIGGLVAVLRQEAFNHKWLQPVDGRLANGMAVMAMGAHTGCNTVYGSTPPNNPHPYPWMNSLFQDGSTITWLFAESFITDNARHSIVPERITDHLIKGKSISEQDYFNYTHFTDEIMTDLEIAELPKVWAIGGDGGMGDIGFQNVSKVVLQNRPNVKILMLDTQVYSNTGGQNSDSSPMTGGFDMNQLGAATQGKLVEMKNTAECFLGGHGSPFVAQVSMADEPRFYKSILDGLCYRGTAYFHCYTTCQPEHGVADDMATQAAKMIRDSRGLPDFVFNPNEGERYEEALSIQGNRHPDRDWMQAKYSETKEAYNYTVAHWCTTEARFRRHLQVVKEADIAGLLHIDDMMLRITQRDVVSRRYNEPKHRAYVPDFGVYIKFEAPGGKIRFAKLSRQMVLFCVERRKAWRLLQSKAGQVNRDYQVQSNLLDKLAKEEISLEDFHGRGGELAEAEMAAL
jgi:pyruvate-ferredoxin/flavodoxin oxidoreductase